MLQFVLISFKYFPLSCIFFKSMKPRELLTALLMNKCQITFLLCTSLAYYHQVLSNILYYTLNIRGKSNVLPYCQLKFQNNLRYLYM